MIFQFGKNSTSRSRKIANHQVDWTNTGRNREEGFKFRLNAFLKKTFKNRDLFNRKGRKKEFYRSFDGKSKDNKSIKFNKVFNKQNLVVFVVTILCLLGLFYTYIYIAIDKNITESKICNSYLIVESGGVFPEDIRKAYYYKIDKERSLGSVVHIPPEVYISDYAKLIGAPVQVRSMIKMTHETLYSKYGYVDEKLLYRNTGKRILDILGVRADCYLFLGESGIKEFGLYPEWSINLVSGLPKIYRDYDRYVLYSDVKLGNLIQNNSFVQANIGKSIKVYSLDEQYTRKDKFIDGTEIALFDIEKIDELVSTLIVKSTSEEVHYELAGIEIFNGTKARGLAAQLSRKYRNSGFEVVRIGSTVSEYNKSTIFVRDRQKFAQTLDFCIESLMLESIEVIEGSPDFFTTGDIVVVIGNDYSIY